MCPYKQKRREFGDKHIEEKTGQKGKRNENGGRYWSDITKGQERPMRVLTIHLYLL